MTVLAWKHGIIAADRRVMFDDQQMQAPVCKLMIGMADEYKFVVGVAGNSESDDVAVELAAETLNTGLRPDYEGEMLLLITALPLNMKMKPRLIVVDYEENPLQSTMTTYIGRHLPNYLARGTGADVALGCMRQRGSAKDAVLAAAEHVPTCGDGMNYVNTNLDFKRWRIR